MSFLTNKFALAMVALVLVGAAGAFGASRLLAATPRTEFRTVPVQRSNITQAVAVSGAVNASSQVKLSFRSAGKLAAVLVSVGQSVNAGDVLAKLDDADQQVSLQQAQASLASAQAKYAAALSGDDIAALRLSVDQAQRTLDRISSNYAAAKANLDAFYAAANADRGSANLSLTAAQSTLATLQNDLATDTQYADVRTAATTANTIQANLQQAQVQAAVLDQALADLGSAILALKAQVAGADAGRPDPQTLGSAQATLNAAQARAQSAVESLNGPLATALTNANGIIASLTTVATKSDASLNQTRTDASALAQQITGAQQQLVAAKSRLGALSGPLQTIADAITGSSIANAQNALASAKQSLQAKLDSRQSDLQSALSAVQSAQAGVDSARNAIGNMTLVAPIAGVVAQIGGQPGEFVGASTATSPSPFLLLSDTGALALHGTVGEADVARLQAGQVAMITIDAIGTEKRFRGKVISLDPVATIQQGVPVYGVDVTLDGADPAIRSGMSGTANIVIASKRDVLVVPNAAIRNIGGRRGVQVVRDGQPADVPGVQFGISNDQVSEVTNGLAEGDLVVLPTARPNPSAPIRVPGGGGGGPPR